VESRASAFPEPDHWLSNSTTTLRSLPAFTDVASINACQELSVAFR
jgi:hypothetical protein